MATKYFLIGLFIVFGVIFTLDIYVIPYKESLFKAKTLIPILVLYVVIFYVAKYIWQYYKSKQQNP